MSRASNGQFLAGPDPDRHVFSRFECQKGFALMMRAAMPSRRRCSIRKKIRGYYQAQAAQRRLPQGGA